VARSNEQMNVYMKARYKRKREEALQYLGGVCIKCGSSENLQFDHIDRDTKECTIADCLLWAKDRLIKELDKCQLLCAKCHQSKTLIDLGRTDGKNTHGTLTSYQYCHCDLCKKAQREYGRRWRELNKARKINMSA
jgi:hypothetical protein